MPRVEEVQVFPTSRQMAMLKEAGSRIGQPVPTLLVEGGLARASRILHPEPHAGLTPPVDLTLPLFVYGNLKPGELGHHLIARHVVRSDGAVISGVLWEVDGMPMLTMGEDSSPVLGTLLTFDPDHALAAYEAVSRFEPATHYEWAHVQCDGPNGASANVLAAMTSLSPAPDGGDRLHEPWSTTRDPLFTHGLPSVAKRAKEQGLRPFSRGLSVGSDFGEWDRFFALQSAYLLASSILERVGLRVVKNAGDGPTKMIEALGANEGFCRAVRDSGFKARRSVGAADNPTKVVELQNPSQFAAWAYQIRCNLVHQGKSAGAEAELVRVALLDLHDVLRTYLLSQMDAFGMVWEEQDPDGTSRAFRLRPLLGD